jgi:hypothetical protein
MQILYEGTTASLILMLIIIGIMIYTIRAALAGRMREVRRLPGMDAIEEAIGRATEMGRPVIYGITDSTRGKLMGSYAPATLAGLTILGWTSQLTARLGARLIVGVASPDTLALHEEQIRTAYMTEGKPEDVGSRTEIHYFGEAWQQGNMGLVAREKPAAYIGMGAFWGSFIPSLEAANSVGAMTIMGSTRHIHTPYMACMSDYILIGEEVFAASGYASKAPIEVGSIAGQDFAKIISITLTLLGVIAISAGSKALENLLSM